MICINVIRLIQKIIQMSVQQALTLWKSQLPRYDRIIAKCIKQITKPLSRFYPPEFETRVQEFKELLESHDGNELTEEYADVIVDFIEGQKNKSMIQLADELLRKFGGDLKYWQNSILDLAENVNYGSEITVWEVKRPFQERLFMDAQNLRNFRQFTKITKSYLLSLKNLTKNIRKFDSKKDSVAKIDDLYKKVKKIEERYIAFGEEVKMFEKSQTLDDLSNGVSQMSRHNAKKTLFHYFRPNQKKEQVQNTLLNYNFKIEKPKSQRASGPTTNIFTTQQMIKGGRLKDFELCFSNIKNNYQNFDDLRNQFKEEKCQAKEKEKINYTTIWDKDYYFSYNSYPIQNNETFSFLKPFEIYHFVEYDLQSQDELQQLLGEDVENESEMSEVSSDSCKSFLVSDGHLSEDEEQEKIYKPLKLNIETFFGERWSFTRQNFDIKTKHTPSSYAMISLVPLKNNQISLISEEDQEQERILSEIVDGKDKKSIMGEITKRGLKISKGKLQEYLKKYCVKVKRETTDKKKSGKDIYKLLISVDTEKSSSSKEKEVEIGTDDNQELDEESQVNCSLQNPKKIPQRDASEGNRRVTRKTAKNIRSQ